MFRDASWLVAELLSESGRIRLDSASEAFLSWDRAVALVSSEAGDEEPAPREKE